MAPNVPYSGVPQVAVGGTPQSRFRADVSPTTFGAGVGEALGSLGGQLKSTGNELFERGIAMQTLYNQSEAQEADAQYTEKAGLLHANYNSLQGKQAVDAYPQYIADLKQTRTTIRDGLSNEMSQKLFESASNGTMGRSIFNGAGHAAGQNKAYALGASTARIAAIGNTTLSQPTDERSFTQGLATTEREVRAQAELQGLSPEATDEAISMQRSKLWGERVKGMAKQDPITAGRWLEDGIKRGDIRGEDIGKLTNVVQQQRNTVGARMISKQVNSGEGARMGAGIVPIDQAAAAIGQFESGGRYDLQGPEVFNKKTGASRGRALGKYQVMPENLPSWLAESGLPPMTPGEFLKSPSAQDQVFNTIFGKEMKKHGNFNDAASVWFTGRPMAQAGNATDAQPGYKGVSAPAYVAGTNAILAKNAPLDRKMQEGVRIASTVAPDDPLFPEYVEQRIKMDNDRAIAVRKDTEFQNKQVIEDALMGGQTGKLPTTVEELTDTPEKAQAWQDLLSSNQRRYMNVLARNTKGDVVHTPQTLRETQRYKGMAQDDPAGFLDEDFASKELPISDRRALMNLQLLVKKQASGDPRVARALQTLGPDLQAAGITSKNKDEYQQFVGALSDWMSEFAEENKKQPKAEDIRVAGSRLLQQTKNPSSWFGSKSPVFSMPVPSDEAETIKADPAWTKLGITPTPEQIQRIYAQSLYQKLYGKASGSPGGMPSPSVGISK